MKRRSIFLFPLLLPAFLAASCGESAPKKPLTYGFYTIKEGVDDLSFLQGYPWINTSVAGVMGKIEKPKKTDDFFACVNYETLQNVTLPEGVQLGGGFYDAQTKKNKENVDALFKDPSNGIAKIKKTIIEGALSEVKAEIESLLRADDAAIRATLASSKTLEGVSKFLKVTHTTGREEIGLAFAEDMHIGGLPFLVQLYSASSTEGLKKDLELIASSIGLGAEAKGAIAEAIDAMAAMFVAIKDEDKKTLHEATLATLDQPFNGVFAVKSALKSLGCADTQKVLFSDYEVALAKQFDALAEAGKTATIGKILAVNKMADGRFFLGLDNYKAKLADKLGTIGGVTGSSPEFDPKASSDDIARSFVERIYPEAIKRTYIDTHVKADSRDKVIHLVESIVDQCADVFNATTWLSKETVAKAIEKLDALEFTVFYDDDYVSIAPFSVKEGENALAAFGDYSHYVTLGLAEGNISNDAIGDEKCDTFNAFYVPDTNSFMVCHGLCSSFIDDPNLTKEQLYGLVGVIAGHEITHGFDSTGSLYDKTGKMVEWWSPEDRAKFNEKIGRLVTYFDTKVRSFSDDPMNGANVSGELMADMGGMKIVSELAEKQSGFDFDLFYRSFASFFGFVTSEEAARASIPYDPPPLNNTRLNLTLSQFERFRITYGLKETDGMYVPPEQTIAIW